MIDNRLEIVNLMKIYNSAIKRKCINYSEKVRKEIMIKLLNGNKFIGIIANSDLYVSSIELYKIEYDIATSVGYLNIRCRENNKLFYYFSKDVNVANSGKEIEYTNFINVADIIVDDLHHNFL